MREGGELESSSSVASSCDGSVSLYRLGENLRVYQGFSDECMESSAGWSRGGGGGGGGGKRPS